MTTTTNTLIGTPDPNEENENTVGTVLNFPASTPDPDHTATTPETGEGVQDSAPADPGAAPAPNPADAEVRTYPAEPAEETDPDRPVPVDPVKPPPGSLADRFAEAKRREILPKWLTSVTEAKQTAGWAAGYAGHVSAFHAVRAPGYLLQVVARSPHGVTKATKAAAGWLSDAEGMPLRRAAARNEDANEYLRLSAVRNRRVWLRGGLAAAVAGFGAPTVVALSSQVPTWEWYGVGLGLAVVFGLIGRREDKPILGRAVAGVKVPVLTSDVILRALDNLGISGLSKGIAKGGQDGVVFNAPITRDGPGWRADLTLPPGVTAGDVMDKREKLSSGLRRPLGCVWPEPVRDEHEGRLVLWVGDKDMRKAPQPAWPLLKGGAIDLFQTQPFATDQRGRWVKLTLMFISMVIGSIPRMGKTFTLRLVLAIAALDPRAELHTYDLKGTGDLDPLEPITHRHAVGDEPDAIEYAVNDMRALRDELRRRAKVIRSLPRNLCPENKVTPALASNSTLGLHPIVIGVDECQVWFEHPDYGKELEAICTDLVKRGPALGVVLILATQRPDAKSLPTGISANASTRFCLKVTGQTENDMVLGTSQYKNGVRATTFAWADKGMGYLVGEGADARLVRTVKQDGPDIDKLVARARELRRAAGTLSGHAIGQDVEVDTDTRDTLLADILAVVAETEKKIWNEKVIQRLGELRPGVYDTFTKAEDLTAALKRHGVTTAQVWGTTDEGKGSSRIGITRTDIQKKVTERNREQGGS